jgi:hypothetical protein
MHFKGDEKELDAIAKKTLGVEISAFRNAFSR